MAVNKIIKMGNPVLRKVASKFTIDEIKLDSTKKLIKDMWDTMRSAGGIGLAAPQIGISKQLAIINILEDSTRYPDSQESEEFIIFNPLINYLPSDKQGYWEGCLSVPGLRGFVKRPSRIQVDYLDENATEKKIVLNGFLATVFQHELDHLRGKLFIDRMDDLRKLSYEDEFSVSDESILLD
ncbi:MAG: peptide deformylase [Candidatus Marinimicrobia bacterium]|nr:peptide deformylase [Candidatus Neomarinimicrobiota bacterium]